MLVALLLLPPAARVCGVAVGLDLLLADLLGDGLLVADGLLVHPHPLLGHGARLDDDLFLVQYDLVLLLGDSGAVMAAPTLASVIGSRSTRTSSRRTGTVCSTCSRLIVLGALAALVVPSVAQAGHTTDPRTKNIHPLGHIIEPAVLGGFGGANPDIHTDIAF